MSASSVKPLNVQLPAITLILFALCIGIFCYLAQWMSYEEVDQSALIHLGANVAPLTLSGEPWRFPQDWHRQMTPPRQQAVRWTKSPKTV